MRTLFKCAVLLFLAPFVTIGYMIHIAVCGFKLGWNAFADNMQANRDVG